MTLGLGEEANEYEFVRIGTASEKNSVLQEIQELREKLAQVDEWKQRKQHIEEELSKVWVSGKQELEAPEYHQEEAATT